MGVNHIGPFTLTLALSETLKASKQCRIINVSSLAHEQVKGFNVEDLNMDAVKEGENGIA